MKLSKKVIIQLTVTALAMGIAPAAFAITNSADSHGANCPSDGSAREFARVPVRSYFVNGRKVAENHGTDTSGLTGKVDPGDKVKVNFKVDERCKNLNLYLASYKAPTTNNGRPYSEQVLFDSQGAARQFSGGWHSLEVTVPRCTFQVDFVAGMNPNRVAAQAHNLYAADYDNRGGRCDNPPPPPPSNQKPNVSLVCAKYVEGEATMWRARGTDKDGNDGKIKYHWKIVRASGDVREFPNQTENTITVTLRKDDVLKVHVTDVDGARSDSVDSSHCEPTPPPPADEKPSVELECTEYVAGETSTWTAFGTNANGDDTGLKYNWSVLEASGNVREIQGWTDDTITITLKEDDVLRVNVTDSDNVSSDTVDSSECVPGESEECEETDEDGNCEEPDEECEETDEDGNCEFEEESDDDSDEEDSDDDSDEEEDSDDDSDEEDDSDDDSDDDDSTDDSTTTSDTSPPEVQGVQQTAPSTFGSLAKTGGFLIPPGLFGSGLVLLGSGLRQYARRRRFDI